MHREIWRITGVCGGHREEQEPRGKRLASRVNTRTRRVFSFTASSMDDDYYSIDSILAENQKIQCTFKVDIPDMGHLDGGTERDIKALSKIQIPMWMAYILIYSYVPYELLLCALMEDVL